MAKHRKDEDGVVVPAVAAEELERALAKAREDEGEQVQLVAITMKKSSKIQVPVARGFKFVEVAPLQLSPPVAKTWADNVVQERMQRSKNVRPALVWHVAPPPRPKNAQKKYFERGGRRFYTDVYAPPEKLTVNGREIHHSISQSIHFISKVLRTSQGIQRWITDFDTRPDVAAWGNYVIQQKEAAEREMLGIGTASAVVI
jgi:hypothetical protein